MTFGFNTKNLTEKMSSAGHWGKDVKSRIKRAAKEQPISPKVRKDCKTGERMLLTQARKVVESGFVKTRLDRKELASEFHTDEAMVEEILQDYFAMVNWGNTRSSFRDIDEVFSCLVTSDDFIDYHWRVLDKYFGGPEQKYVLDFTEATRLERMECFYFSLVMTKMSAGDLALGNGFIRVKPGYSGERYVQTVYDLGWFLAGKMLGTIDETATPMRFFSEKDDWWKYNQYPVVPAYVTKLMEARKRMPGGVTSSEDILSLFDDGAYEESLMKGVVPKREYLDVKLLEWATKVKEAYGEYVEKFEC